MSKVRVACFSISIDGYGAGPEQSLKNPQGIGGINNHKWMFPTEAFQKRFGNNKGTTGVDNDFAARGFENIGAWIIGRNMFTPERGPWTDSKWKGWWGDNPPYHVPVFILTHHARDPIKMDGGTTFHFVTGGIHEALRQAREAAGGKDVRVGGGTATIQQYLRERLIDEMHIAISSIILGSGERLFNGIDMPALGYEVAEHVPTPNATHILFKKK